MAPPAQPTGLLLRGAPWPLLLLLSFEADACSPYLVSIPCFSCQAASVEASPPLLAAPRRRAASLPRPRAPRRTTTTTSTTEHRFREAFRDVERSRVSAPRAAREKERWFLRDV